MTMNLDWRHLFHRVYAAAAENCDQVLASAASPRQCLQVIDNAVRPYITYVFSVAPYTTSDLAKLDGLLRRVAKATLELPVSFPSSAVHGDCSGRGLGAASLRVQHAQMCAATLVTSISSAGALGVVTARLLKLQLRHMGSLPASEWPAEARTCHLVRQLSVCEDAGLEDAKGTDVVTLGGTGLRRCLDGVVYDPRGLGQSLKIPTTVLQPLYNLGVTSLTQLLEPGGKRLMSANALNWRFRAKPVH